MKITKHQLRKLIKEELLKEEYASQLLARAEGALQDLVDDETANLSFEDVRIKELREILATLFKKATKV